MTFKKKTTSSRILIISQFFTFDYTCCVLSNNLLTSYPPFSPAYFSLKSTLLSYFLFLFSSSIINVVCRQWYRFYVYKIFTCMSSMTSTEKKTIRKVFPSSTSLFASLIFFCILIQLLCFMLTLYEQQQQLTSF